ncbi:hypothetical protein TNCV_2338651 [Trichonephila clavipes]|nr:hypothetical protein TNCV_2338651 [Trichonephila clavipes]
MVRDTCGYMVRKGLIFKIPGISLGRRRSHYQQLTKFELERVIALWKGDFLSVILHKDFAGMYRMDMIGGSSGQGKILPEEDRVTCSHVALLREKIAMLVEWLLRIVLRLLHEIELQLAAQQHNEPLQLSYFKDSSMPDGLQCRFN